MEFRKLRINAIVNMNGGELFYEGQQYAPDRPSFRMILDACTYDNLFGYEYDAIRFDVVRGRQLNKQEFKLAYSLYREYINQSQQDCVEP